MYTSNELTKQEQANKKLKERIDKLTDDVQTYKEQYEYYESEYFDILEKLDKNYKTKKSDGKFAKKDKKV